MAEPTPPAPSRSDSRSSLQQTPPASTFIARRDTVPGTIGTDWSDESRPFTSPEPAGTPVALVTSSRSTFTGLFDRGYVDDRAQAILRNMARSHVAPRFSGNEGESVELFLGALAKAFNDHNVPEDEDHARLAIALECIEGEARAIAETWTLGDTPNYATFAKKLEFTFLYRHLQFYDLLAPRYKLHHIRQTTTVKQYITAFNAELNRMAVKPSEETQATMFFCGLQADVRENVRVAAAKLLELEASTALAAAEKKAAALNAKATGTLAFWRRSKERDAPKKERESVWRLWKRSKPQSIRFQWSLEAIQDLAVGTTSRSLMDARDPPPPDQSHRLGHASTVVNALHHIRYNSLPFQDQHLFQSKRSKGSITSKQMRERRPLPTLDPSPTSDEMARLIQLSVIKEEGEDDQGGWTRKSTTASSATDTTHRQGGKPPLMKSISTRLSSVRNH